MGEGNERGSGLAVGERLQLVTAIGQRGERREAALTLARVGDKAAALDGQAQHPDRRLVRHDDGLVSTGQVARGVEGGRTTKVTQEGPIDMNSSSEAGNEGPTLDL